MNYHQYLLSLRKVYREDEDSVQRRLSSTPPPTKYNKNWKLFRVATWQNQTDSSGRRNAESILTLQTVFFLTL